MSTRPFVLMIMMLAALAAGCSQNQVASDNANANATAAASPITTAGPDNSEITTSVDATGTRTETRTFRDNPRISRVVVTTRDGRRTVRAVSPSGEEREVSTTENVLEATGETIANAAGFVADKGEDAVGEAASGAKKVGSEVADKAEDVGDKTVSGAKKVGSEVADKAEDVGDKTVSGAKKAGRATKKAVKKVIP